MGANVVSQMFCCDVNLILKHYCFSLETNLVGEIVSIVKFVYFTDHLTSDEHFACLSL